MDIKQISDTLNRIFTEKNKRIIFWYDGEREFDEILPSLELMDADILRMDEHSALELKIKLEIDDPAGKYVFTRPGMNRPRKMTGCLMSAYTVTPFLPIPPPSH
jgi:hypothetical protein